MNICPTIILAKQHSTLQYSSPSHVSREVGITNCSIDISSDSNNNSSPHVDSSNNYFTVSQDTLSNLLHSTDHAINNSFSISDVLNALRTDVTTGICGDDGDLDLRRQAFGSNFEECSSIDDEAKECKKLIVEAIKDTTIILLFCCATLSLVIGIEMNGLKEGLLNGAIIFVSILIVVNCGILCRYLKARLMRIKNLSRSGNSLIRVIRCGELQHVDLGAIVVGDILCLESVDNVPVPADGLIIEGDNSLEIDDGEVHKLAFVNKSNYFSVFSGAKVVAGSCRVLVTSVGKHTERSKMMRSIIICDESKLVGSIKKTNSKLEKISLWLSLLVLVVQLLRCFISKSKYCDEDHDDPDVKHVVEEIMRDSTKLIKREGTFRFKGLVSMLCVLLFAIRDGLPIGLFILLAYASKKAMIIFPSTLVQDFSASATSSMVSALCVSETDDLIIHHRNMADLWIGVEEINQAGEALIQHELLNEIHKAVICMKDDNLGYVEDSLIWWADEFFLKCYDTDESDVSKDSTFVYNKYYKNGSDVLLMEKKEVGNSHMHVYCKGLPHIVLSMCSQFYHADGTMQTLDHQKRATFNKIFDKISKNNYLSCFAFAYKHIVPREKEEPVDNGMEKFAKDGFTLLCLVALKNPISAKCRVAIKECKESEINIKLLVNNDIKTARLIAIDSGIITPHQEEIPKGGGHLVIEASEFRNSSDEDRMNMIDNIHVMANSSPSDKLLMVQCLKQKGKIVAATGISVRDSPLMKESDVGFFLGNCDAEIAKRDADIVLTDKNLVTLLGIIKLGRYVHINVVKFIQLQLILNISAFTINFMSVILSTNVEPLTPFEILWANSVINISGAFVLAASMIPLNSSLSVRKSAGNIITKTMWRKILVQCLYQVACTLIINMKGRDIVSVDHDDVLRAIVFNCFVLCQVFLLIGARVMDKTFFSEGKNVCMFCIYVGAIFIVQAVVIEILVVMFSGKGRLDMKQWSICIGIGAVSLLIEGALKWELPDDHV